MAAVRIRKNLLVASVSIVALLVLGFVAVDQLCPLPFDALTKPYSTLVYDRDDCLLMGFLASDDKWRLPVDNSSVSPEFEKILLTYEDRWYFWHFGVNPAALARALLQNMTEGRVVSGGSTLTMQVARLLEPKERTLVNKCKEMIRAIQLEVHFTKQEILQMYYHMAPYGGNIEGIRAAALLYFGKSPNELSIGEAALLAAIPSSPERIRPDRYPDRALAARNKVLTRALRYGVISEEQYRIALNEEVPTRRKELPFAAPHLVERLYRQKDSSQSVIRTTLDLEVQSGVERLLRNHISSLEGEGAINGAVVILDNYTHSVVALVGSTDYFDDQVWGQVDATQTLRPSGAMLQPFIYGMAFERGLATPKSYLEDVPIHFGTSGSEDFSGLVRVDYALAQSLNTPAVRLLNQLGSNALAELLEKAGVSLLTDEDNYGLSTDLDGVEVNLFGLTVLYSALATGGQLWQPVSLTGSLTKPIRLLSEEAAYLVTTILKRQIKPNCLSNGKCRTLPEVAWMTGSVSGSKGAWSVGYTPEYTVGVWIGILAQRGSIGLIGEEVAEPILFEIFDSLIGDGIVSSWFKGPNGVHEREVCALSGQVPGPHCSHTITDSYIPGVSSESECDLHQVVWISPAGEYVLRDVSADSNFRQVRYIKWPELTAKWLEADEQIVFRLAAEDFREVCPRLFRIISPVANHVYQIKRGVSRQDQKIAFDAVPADDAVVLYWFIDGDLICCGPPGQKVFYAPFPGKHIVVCQDDRGRSTKVEFEVRR